MIAWNCIVKNGYCNGTPEWDKEPIQSSTGFFGMGTCKLTPDTCGKYKTSQQLWDELPQEERDRVSKTTYRETIIRKESTKETPKKIKTKVAQEYEKEIAQRSMF